MLGEIRLYSCGDFVLQRQYAVWPAACENVPRRPHVQTPQQHPGVPPQRSRQRAGGRRRRPHRGAGAQHQPRAGRGQEAPHADDVFEGAAPRPLLSSVGPRPAQVFLVLRAHHAPTL